MDYSLDFILDCEATETTPEPAPVHPPVAEYTALRDGYSNAIMAAVDSVAPAVVHSLWPVEDRGTQHFMLAFHAGLADDDVTAAWLAAREATRAAGFAPAVYGAFVLGGSARVSLKPRD